MFEKTYEAWVTLGQHVVMAAHCDSLDEAVGSARDMEKEFLADNPDATGRTAQISVINIDNSAQWPE